MTTPTPSPYDPAQQSAQPIVPQPVTPAGARAQHVAQPQESPSTPDMSAPSDEGVVLPPRTRRARPTWLVPAGIGCAVGVAATLAVTTAVPALLSAVRTSPLESAYADCKLESAVGISLRDKGRTITFDNKGEEDLIGAEYLDILCLFTSLEMPSSITSHIGQTTSMDGRQSESWDGKTVSWSYHPDRGLDGVLTLD